MLKLDAGIGEAKSTTWTQGIAEKTWGEIDEKKNVEAKPNEVYVVFEREAREFQSFHFFMF